MSITIAICDDEQIEIKYLSALVHNWADNNKIDITLEIFQSAEQFLFEYEDNLDFDVLLLDIMMKDIDGMELAKKIRENNDTTQIIFITGFPDYMPLGYEVSALHYLMKPVNEEVLYKVLDKAVNLLNKEEESLIVELMEGMARIPIDKILYMEAFSHNTMIYTLEENYQARKGISELEGLLDDSFIRCHRSYVVGLMHIKRLMKTEIILDDGQVIPLSRRLHTNVNQAFIHYYKGER